MRVTYKFDDLRVMRDQFVRMMDLLRYGMFDEDLEIGPFSMFQWESGIWVRGPQEHVDEFTTEFEKTLGTLAYTALVEAA